MYAGVRTGVRLLSDKTIIVFLWWGVWRFDNVQQIWDENGLVRHGDAREIVYISNCSCRKGWSCEDKSKLCVDKNYGHDLSASFTVETHASNNDDLLGLFQDTPLRESGADDFTCAAI